MGQICRGSVLGELIYSIVSNETSKTIVEIGLWKGMGSTKCILDALIDSKKKNFVVYSLEINKKFYDEALNNLKPVLDNLDASNIHLLYGSILNENEVPKFESSEMVSQWYFEDVNNIKLAPKIKALPKVIDVLILDGGEYTTYPEYLKLKQRSKIIILDDVNSYKNKKVRQELLVDSDFELQYEDLVDRNGYSIFKKKVLK